MYRGGSHPHEAAAAENALEELAPGELVRQKKSGGGKVWRSTSSTGRRDGARARWRACGSSPGSGAVTVNKRSLDDYFPNNVLKMVIKQPLLSTETAENFDIHVTVAGGGPSGQAGAIRHGISRALTEYNAELRKKLKKEGFLTRDPRMKERKKYGQRGARARFQFSKR